MQFIMNVQSTSKIRKNFNKILLKYQEKELLAQYIWLSKDEYTHGTKPIIHELLNPTIFRSSNKMYPGNNLTYWIAIPEHQHNTPNKEITTVLEESKLINQGIGIQKLGNKRIVQNVGID